MRTFALLLSSLLCAASHAASPDTAGIDAMMKAYQGDVPGASLLVVKDGKAVLSKSYGAANLEAHEAATPATNYRLASVSKQFTAAGILLLS
ncbi:MAG: serine hydrolase, partial [Dyella sp.]|nr:serine hydrolase [Dyella sp.]